MIQAVNQSFKHTSELPPEVRAHFAISEIERLDHPPANVVSWLGDKASDAQRADLDELLKVDRQFRWRVGRLLQSAMSGGRPDACATRPIVRENPDVAVGAGIVGMLDHLRGLLIVSGVGLDWGVFGRRSLTTACAAVRLARATNQPTRALETFGAGLLHDLGVIGLCCLFPRGYARVVRRCSIHHADETETERAILGVDHCDAGDRMARTWRLPIWLVACAGRHHASSASSTDRHGDDELVNVVRIADLIARQRTRQWGAGKVASYAGNASALTELTWDDVAALSLGIGDDVDACLSIVTGSTSPASQRRESMNALGDETTLPRARVLAGAREPGTTRGKGIKGSRDQGSGETKLGSRQQVGVFGRSVFAGRVRNVPHSVQRFTSAGGFGIGPSAPPPFTLPRVGLPPKRDAKNRGGLTRGDSTEANETTAEMQDACCVLAKAAGRALGVDGRLIVFRLDRSGGFCHVAESDSPRVSSSVIRTLPAADASQLRHRLITQPPAWLGPVGDRLRQGIGPGSEHCELLLAPVVYDRRLIGGVLFASPDDPVKAASVNAAWLLHHDLFASLLMAEAQLSALQRGAAHRSPFTTDASDKPAGENRDWLARIASVASGAAHELNTPLAVISGRAQLLSSAITDERQRMALETIVAQASLASNLVSDLLAVGDPPGATVRPISLMLLLEQLRVGVLAERSMSPGRFAIRLADPGVVVVADADQLKQILAAVLANAFEHGGDENVRIVVNSASRASDDTVVLSVEDNGRGMAPEVLARARDPFFSIRGSSRGRGLGLARAYSLALNNGGDLWIESRPGQGTAVFIALPGDQGGRA